MGPTLRTTVLRYRMALGLGWVLACATGCPTYTDVMGGDDDVSAPDEEVPGDSDDAFDTAADLDGPIDAVEPLPPATIHVEVWMVPVYYERLDGDLFGRRELEWTEVDPGGYPYGSIYVALTEELGANTDPLAYTIHAEVPPDPRNDPAELSFVVEELVGRTVYVAAVADRWADGVVSPNDSMAYDPRPITIEAHGQTEAQIFVDVDLDWDGSGWGPSQYCRSAILPGCIVEADLEGEIRLADSLAPGTVGPSVVGLYTADGSVGPLEATLPGELDGGAPEEPLPWALHIRVPPCGDGGFGLFGGWDSNGNGMIEPSDEWGTLWSDDGFDPTLQVSHGDWITGLEIRVPWDGTAPPFAYPYKRIAGVIDTDDSFSLAELGPTDTLHVMALRESAEALPTWDLVDDGPARQFLWDIRSFPAAGLDGEPVPFELMAPWDAYVHLLAGIEVGGSGGLSCEYTLTQPEQVLDLCSTSPPDDVVLELGNGG